MPPPWLVLVRLVCVAIPALAATDNFGQTDNFDETGLNLGSVFDIEDLSNPFEQLGKWGCLPSDFDVGNSTVEAIKYCLKWVEELEMPSKGKPRMGFYYQCLRERLGVLTSSGFNSAGFVSLITSFSSDSSWRARAGQLALRCISASDPAGCSGLSARRQAVAVLACWRWSLALECDMKNPLQRPHWSGGCRRARFLSGACARGPGAILRAITSPPNSQAGNKAEGEAGPKAEGEAEGQAGPLTEKEAKAQAEGQGNKRWASCLSAMRSSKGASDLKSAVAAGDLSEERCQTLEPLAEEFVYCLMEEFTIPSSRGRDRAKVDFELLRSAAITRIVDMQKAMTLLDVIDSCGDEKDLRGFVNCWMKTQIMTCATDEALRLTRSY